MRGPTLTNRTTWRDIPRGRAAKRLIGQSSRAVSQGRSRSSGVGSVVVMLRATGPCWHFRGVESRPEALACVRVEEVDVVGVGCEVD